MSRAGFRLAAKVVTGRDPAAPKPRKRVKGEDGRSHGYDGDKFTARNVAADYIALCQNPLGDLSRWLAEDKKRPGGSMRRIEATANGGQGYGDRAGQSFGASAHHTASGNLRCHALPAVRGWLDEKEERRRGGDGVFARPRAGFARYDELRQVSGERGSGVRQGGGAGAGLRTGGSGSHASAAASAAAASSGARSFAANAAAQANAKAVFSRDGVMVSSGVPARHSASNGASAAAAGVSQALAQQSGSRASVGDSSVKGEQAALSALYRAKIEACRRSLPAHEIAAAIHALVREMGAALKALTDRRSAARAAKAAARGWSGLSPKK